MADDFWDSHTDEQLIEHADIYSLYDVECCCCSAEHKIKIMTKTIRGLLEIIRKAGLSPYLDEREKHRIK